MGALDWLLLALVAVGICLAVRRCRRGDTGGCCGDCTRCHRAGCGMDEKK